jgi:succinate-acetate transporter protein
MSTKLIEQDAAAAPAPATPATTAPVMADPTPIGYAMFAFALALFGIRYVNVGAASVSAGPASVGVEYAFLIAGIAQVVAGVVAIVRGMAYSGWILSTFGIWLLGFFFLVTIGAARPDFQPDSVTWYVLVLALPVAIFAIPEVVHRNIPFVLAFAAILVLMVLLGLGFHNLQHAHDAVTAAKAATDPSVAGKLAGAAKSDVSSAASRLKDSAWFAFAGAGVILWIFAQKVLTITGVIQGSTN